VELPDEVHHVTARGNERQPIVREDANRERFLETLEQMVQRFGVAIRVYCLMLNHLLLQTPRANLSAAMGWFQAIHRLPPKMERRKTRAIR
jgi:putative transposase